MQAKTQILLILRNVGHLIVLVLQKKAQQGKPDSQLQLSVSGADQSWMGQPFGHQPVLKIWKRIFIIWIKFS